MTKKSDKTKDDEWKTIAGTKADRVTTPRRSNKVQVDKSKPRNCAPIVLHRKYKGLLCTGGCIRGSEEAAGA